MVRITPSAGNYSQAAAGPARPRRPSPLIINDNTQRTIVDECRAQHTETISQNR
jgi:hypothetical protein